MEFRMATLGDLSQIKKVYQTIIDDMNEKNIAIWDEVYPCEYFEQDIADQKLYVLLDDAHCMVSAFVLENENDGAEQVTWRYPAKKPVYIDRFGVNPRYARQGIGQMMLYKARHIAKDCGADSLRLFVVDINRPAISLYEKAGFLKADGIYHEVIDEDYVLKEYGYEFPLA